MAITPADLRLDLRAAKTGGKGKPCGESHIPRAHDCDKGKGKGKKPAGVSAAEVSQKVQAVAVVGLGVAYIGMSAVALKSVANAREAYKIKFEGNESLTPLANPIGKKLELKRFTEEPIGDPSAFGSVSAGKDKNGDLLITKRLKNAPGAPVGIFGPDPDAATQMRGAGIVKASDRAYSNLKTAGKYITKQEAEAAQLAGKLGFGPKVEYADATQMQMRMAKGRPLEKAVVSRQQAEVASGKMGKRLSDTEKKQVLGGLAKMHTSGMAHNDLHPGNIFVQEKGSANFIDFGTATKGGGAVAKEWARMQNNPRLGTQEAGGFGYNLRTVTPEASRATEGRLKKIIGMRRPGTVREIDIERALKRKPGIEKELQSAIDDYYQSIFSGGRMDSAQNIAFANEVGALTAGHFRKDWIGNSRKQKCGPKSKPCGKACIPKNHKCRASWNKPVKAAALTTAVVGGAVAVTAIAHPQKSVRWAAQSLAKPLLHGGFAAGNAARGNLVGAANNFRDAVLSGRNFKRNLSKVARAYGTAIKGGFNFALGRNKFQGNNPPGKPGRRGSYSWLGSYQIKPPGPKGPRGPKRPRGGGGIGRDPQIRARGGRLPGLRNTLPSSDFGSAYKGDSLTAGFIRGDACWKGYVQNGVKKKGNRTVPNCVPVGKARRKTKKAGLDGEEMLTRQKRSVWAEGITV